MLATRSGGLLGAARVCAARERTAHTSIVSSSGGRQAIATAGSAADAGVPADWSSMPITP